MVDFHTYDWILNFHQQQLGYPTDSSKDQCSTSLLAAKQMKSLETTTCELSCYCILTSTQLVRTGVIWAGMEPRASGQQASLY